MYSDLPIRVRSTLSSYLKESGADARTELKRCFDSTSLSELFAHHHQMVLWRSTYGSRLAATFVCVSI